MLTLYCNVVNGCAYKVLGKDLCIKEVDVYFVLAWIINKTLGLRVSHDEEYVGMDMSQHGEQAHA